MIPAVAFSSNQRETNVDMILVSFTIAEIILNSVSDTNQLFISFPLLLLIKGLISYRGPRLGCLQAWEDGANPMYSAHMQKAAFS